MAYLRRQPINPSCIVDLSKLSSDVMRLRLQALNLPKFCSRMRLLRTLRFVRTSYFSYRARSKNFRTSSGRIAKASRLSSAGQRKQLANRRADGKFTAQSSFTLKQSVSPQERPNCPVIAGSSVDDLLENQLALSLTKNTVISPAQLFSVQETTSSSIKGVFPSPSFHDSHLGGVAHPRTHSHRTSSAAPPLDLDYKVDGDEIFRGEYSESFCRVSLRV